MKRFHDKRKDRWKRMDPEERALFAQKGGRARAAKMTTEALRAHSIKMLDARYELKRELSASPLQTPVQP